ncbi:MAG TPA: vWA domain-containing protein, partial [Phycisphaerae bacterium]|nr:vWA domain-containing protein [Phycisphaerae bacterium]
PAVERAAEMLSPPAGPADATVRHLVLLSDGRSEDFDCPRLAVLCKERAASVSVVATGADADLERLGRLAEQTGGRLYRSADLARLAETFLADLAWARGEGLTEEPRQIVWRDAEPVWRRAGPPLPAVGAWNATRAKEGATVHWETREGAVPLLATWRRGLGKVAAMPWPAGHAGDAWTTDSQLARYLGEVLTWLRSPGEPADWSAGLVERDGRWRIRVEESPSAVAAAPRRFTAAVFESGASTVQDVRLDAVGPGLYEADIGPRSAQAASLAVHAEDAPGVQACLALPGLPPREYERFGVDLKRLETIVRAGGGQVHERLASLADGVAKAEAQGEEPVGIYLVWAAGAVVLALVAGRLAGRL